jgi:hypothetical protein
MRPETPWILSGILRSLRCIQLPSGFCIGSRRKMNTVFYTDTLWYTGSAAILYQAIFQSISLEKCRCLER